MFDPVDSGWFSVFRSDPNHDHEAEAEERNRVSLLGRRGSERELCGRVCATIEIMPAEIAESKPAGTGRSAPNMNPELPPPTGRLKLTAMWNPLYILNECLGPRIFRRVMCCFICVGMGFLAIFGGPFFTIADKLFDFLPGRGPSFALFGSLGMVCCCFTCLCWRLYPK